MSIGLISFILSVVDHLAYPWGEVAFLFPIALIIPGNHYRPGKRIYATQGQPDGIGVILDVKQPK